MMIGTVENQGSTFYISLPLVVESAEQAEALEIAGNAGTTEAAEQRKL